MIILKQAYTQWCDLPGNTVLAAKTRIAAQKVLLDVCADMDEAQAKKEPAKKDPTTDKIKKQREFLRNIPDELILEELRCRKNWHGTVQYTTTITITETF